MNLQYILSSQWLLLAGAAVSAATVGAALLWSKHPIRWLLAVTTLGLAYLAYRVSVPEISDRLPWAFRDFFRAWVFLLSVAAVYALTHLVVTLARLYLGLGAGSAPSAFPDIDDAWREVLIQLSQSRIAPSGFRMYLLLTEDESLAASVVAAAGLEVLVKAPTTAEAPIHCYATEDALFLSVAGASALGRADAQGTTRLEHLCRLIAAENPAEPIVRGVAVLIPLEWARGVSSARQVPAIRDDLQTVRSVLKLRCPTVAVCCLQEESIPGFNDFTSRLPTPLRNQRCGFSVPTTVPLKGEVIRQGVGWMTQWFQLWSLNLMIQEVYNKDGNNRLLSMNVAFRGCKNPLTQLLSSALTVHQQAEPVLFRGCYFVACGPQADRHAFAAGLLAGPKTERRHPLSDLTTWSRDADQIDRGYRRAAWALGLATAAVAVPVWVAAILPRVRPVGGGLVGPAALAALAVLWAAVLLGRRLRPRRAAARA